MMMPFTDMITVYNHARAGRVDTWIRTVLRGVQWSEMRQNAPAADGKSVYQTETRITIPAGVDAGDRRYVTPEVYKTAEDRTDKWTLNSASGNDVIVLGECPAEITAAYTLADLGRDYGCVTIVAVSDNTRRARLKNWKVAAV